MNIQGYIQIVVADRQSVTDAGMTWYGCADGKFLLMQDNPDRIGDYADVLTPGMKLNVRWPIPVINSTNVSIAASYRAKNHIVVMDAADLTSGGASPSPMVAPYVAPGYITGTSAQNQFGHIVPPQRIIIQIIKAGILPHGLQQLTP